jgi:ABC-type branched-subunit amino acid transport system ATPase component
VARHSDRLLVLQKGQVVLQGRSEMLSGAEELARYLGV